MRLLTMILLCFCLSAGAQVTYTVNVDTVTCRVSVGNSQLKYHFLAEKTRYIDRNTNMIIFDDRRSVGFTNDMITNYASFALLKADLDSWFETCNVTATPPVPVPPDLFANVRSIDLTDASDFVSIPDADDLSFTDGAGNDQPFSVTAWVYKSEASTIGEVIISKADTGNYEWALYTTFAGDVFWGFGDIANTGSDFFARRTTPNILPVNEWVHVAGTYDGSETFAGIKTYFNGVRKDASDYSSGIYNGMSNGLSPVLIGDLALSVSQNDSLPWIGAIDQVIIWDEELSQQQIRDLMAIRDTSEIRQIGSIVSYYEFDAPDSTQSSGVKDLVGANTGSTTNMAYSQFSPQVSFPYDYQLVDTLTPYQYNRDTIYGGYSWEFNGTDETIDVPDSDLLSFTDGAGTDEPFSIEAWVKWDDGGSTEFILGKDSTNKREYLWQTVAADGDMVFYCFEASSGDYIARRTLPTVLPHNQWVHVVTTYSGSEASSGQKIYFNAVRVDQADLNNGTYTGMTNTTSSFVIGSNTANALYYDGGLADVKVYDIELSQAQVDSLFNQHEPKDESKRSFADDLVVHYRGYNSDADTAYNQVSTTLDGVLQNMDNTNILAEYPRKIYDSDNRGSWNFSVGEDARSAVTDSVKMLNLAQSADTSFSLSAWVNLDVTNSNFILSATGSTWLLYVNPTDKLTLFIEDNDGTSNIVKSSTVDMDTYVGEWIHVGATYDGSATVGGMELYINGKPIAVTTSTNGVYSNMLTGDTRAFIGTQSQGDISNATIMKGIVLTPIQWDEVYNDGSPKDPTDWTFFNSNFIHYPLNQGDNPTTSGGFRDVIGNIDATGTGTDATNERTKSFPTN